MALVNVVSIGVEDMTGGQKSRKSLALFFPATQSLATIQSALTVFLPKLDAVIDGQIMDATVQLQMTIPGGLKSAPVDGNTVHEGANLRYRAANTNYVHTPYVPSWSNDGFSGDGLNEGGAIDTLTAGIITAAASDKDGNLLTTFLGGERAFRK